MAPFFSWVAKVPDVIGTLKQVGKTTVGPEAGVRTAPAGGSVACTKKFEVQFRGRVSMENNNTPPSLIDECVEWLAADHGRDFWAKQVPRMSDHTVDLVTASAKMAAQIKLLFQPSSRGAQEKVACVREAGLVGSHTPCPPGGQEGVELQQNPCVPSPKGRCKSSSFPEHYQSNPSRPGLIQPTITLENRPVLLMIGQAEIYIMSPDTKKVIVERSFSEMSFCSQGIRHLDHFGFVCREPHEMVSWQWVCYIFQAYAENLVDEIILPLKQAFSVATRTPHPWTQSPQCCPKQQLHQLCGRIQGLHPTSAKLELQKHIATLDSHQQASILEGALASKPKTEQEEIEVLLSSLHFFYEEQQKNHQYNQNGVVKQTGRGEALPEPGVKVREKAREVLGEQQRRPQSEPLEVLWKVSGAFKPAVCSSREAESISYPAITPSCSISTSSRNFPSSTKEGFLDLLPSSPHMSKGDPTQAGLLSREYQHLGFRRRASTYSHPARHHNPGSITPQEPIASIKPRLVRHNSVGTDRACHSCDVAASSSHHHTVPWRQQIFLRVAVSQKSCNAPPGYTTNGATSVGGGYPEAGLHGECPRVEDKDRGRRRVSLVRERWRKAILQQILLLRMEKENQKLQATESDLQNKRLKLGYEEITPCLKDVTMVWEQMLGTPGRSKVQFDTEKVHNAVWQGVPRTHRGEIWQFLSEQHLLRQRVSCRHPDNEAPYRDLLGQLSSQQHAILIDLGRTFPTHPYFSAKLGSGQHSLYNLLKAYSLLDSEVGYCQGLSFVAGVLLLHMDEEEAFGMLTFLMYKMGLRKQYRPDMIILQIQMYQLSRLLHDYHRDLYSHLEKHNIGPSLYATPWFLTVFASHFPLGFVARVFDMVFLQGSDAIFKVALSLLGSHKPLIMQHNNLEAIVDFIKTTLPKLGLVQMEKTINQVFEMDLSKQLQAYEVEYHVLQDQLLEAPTTLSQQQRMAQMERANRCLRQQNLDLLEELQVAHAKLDSLEANVTELLSREGGLQQKIGALEQERASLLKMVAELRAEPPNSTSAPPPGGNGCTPDPPHQPGPNNSHCPQ